MYVKGEYDNIGGKADGMVEGGGDGMSDSVPATIDGKQDLLVSKDEYGRCTYRSYDWQWL